MYKVKYWLLGSLKSKKFNSLHDAVIFSVYKAPYESIHEIYKIED